MEFTKFDLNSFFQKKYMDWDVYEIPNPANRTLLPSDEETASSTGQFELGSGQSESRTLLPSDEETALSTGQFELGTGQSESSIQESSAGDDLEEPLTYLFSQAYPSGFKKLMKFEETGEIDENLIEPVLTLTSFINAMGMYKITNCFKIKGLLPIST